MWSTTRPQADGWYPWRADTEEPVEIIQVWTAKKSRGRRRPPRYGWHEGTVIAKRMHEVDPDELDAIGGEFLANEEGPIRIDLPDEKDAIATEKVAKKDRKPSAKKPGGAKGVPSKPPDTL